MVLDCQPRKYSPPPVPKRSPGTRLSSRDNPFFFPDDETVPAQSSSNDVTTPAPSNKSKTNLESPFSTADVDSGNPNAAVTDNLKTSLLQKSLDDNDESISNQNSLTTHTNTNSSYSTNGISIQDDEVFVPNGDCAFCVACGCVLKTENFLIDQDMAGNKKHWVTSRRVMYENINDTQTNDRNSPALSCEFPSTKKGQVARLDNSKSPVLGTKHLHGQPAVSKSMLNTSHDDVRVKNTKSSNVNDIQNDILLKNTMSPIINSTKDDKITKSPSFQQKLASFRQDGSKPTVQKVTKSPSFHQKLASFQQDSKKSPATIQKITKSPSFHHRLANFQLNNNISPGTIAKSQCDISNFSVQSSEEDMNQKTAVYALVNFPQLQNNKTSHHSDENKNTTSSIEERLRILHEKFAETRLLLSTNQIRDLDKPPPSFKPPPPPHKKNPLSKHQNRSEDIEVPHLRTILPKKQTQIGEHRLLESDETEVYDLGNELVSNRSNQDSVASNLGSNKIATDSVHGLTKEENLCSNCIKSKYKTKTSVINNISELSTMLPTDTLNKPQLGLSYSMEDDMNPGVKEILTSTPKSDVSKFSPEMTTGNSSLSTFSQSYSSLGYGSSQSDLDLNISSQDCDKIPVVSLKSQTLPTGMKLAPSPFYSSGVNPGCDKSSEGKRNGSALKEHEEEEEEEMRSSSAPPMKHLGWNRKKEKWGMNRKDKKEIGKANKNEDSLSLKSNASLDDGLILRRLEPLDGSTEILRPEDRRKGPLLGVPTDEKVKRKSVWKSILRRK